MLLHIALVAEILTTIICIYSIYGERFRLDWKTPGAFFSILMILELINNNHLDKKYSFLVYLILFIYCFAEFQSAIGETLISLVLCMVLVTAAQTVCALFVNMLQIDLEYKKYVVTNLMTVVIFLALFSTNGLYHLKKRMCAYSKFVILVLFITGITIAAILIQGKWFNEVYMQYFLFAIPAIIMLLFSIVKWDAARSEAETLGGRLFEIEENKESFEDLLTEVRLRQHAFKNHIETISFLDNSHKPDEKHRQLEEYCNQLLEENKYNDLLLLGNDVLTGFLYRKIREAEHAGIKVNYKIATKFSQCRVPIYHVVQMLGILFDNAIEAVNGSEKKKILIAVYEENGEFEFLIRNQFPYVSYNVIEEWFCLGKSRKGKGRGLGLYQLKTLCKEWDCDISCRNMEIEEENWVVFTLRMKKADGI